MAANHCLVESNYRLLGPNYRLFGPNHQRVKRPRPAFGRVGKITYLCGDLFNTNNLNHEYQFQIFPRFGAGSQWSFSVSDVKGLVEAFQKYIAVELSLGHSVRIDGLGTFSSALSGKVERSKEGCLRLRRPRVRTVNFRPAVALMRRFGETTFRAEAGAPLTYANPQRDELLEKLRDLGAQQTCFLASDVMRATGMSRDRTYARLRQFVDEGTLLNVGTRRRAVYRLP